MLLDEIRLARFLIVLAFLIYACKLDIESRIVPDRVWKWMLVAALPLTAVEMYLLRELVSSSIALFIILQFLVIFALSYAFYILRAFGGADAKALMCLALIFPLYPSMNSLPLLNNGFGIFAFATLANSVIAAPILALTYFIRNIIREGFKGLKHNPLYYFVGVRVKPSRIPKHHYLLEYIDENGRLVRVKRAIEPNDNLLKRLSKLDKIWVTPALPFLVFITAGYVMAALIGNILYTVISIFLGVS
jgi:preflagellin peptidase FlaK